MKTPITVWRYEESPKELQISTNGGDEDWIAEVPPNEVGSYIRWLEPYGPFGCCCVDIYPHPTKEGWELHIGCHA